MVEAILALAHSLKLEVVAEGVEEYEHVEFLRQHDCEVLQGFYFSKPLSTEEISEVLRQEKQKWEAIHRHGRLTEFSPLLPSQLMRH